MIGPNPNEKHPMFGFPQVCYIKNTVDNPNIIISLHTEPLKKYHRIWIIASELQVRNQSVLENPYGNRYYNESKKEAG